MNRRQLKVFSVVAESGSIAAAARLLCLTQPAVTKTIRDLEEESGVALLSRESSGVSLTGNGERLLTRARLILREFELVENEMAILRGEPGGQLRIGLCPVASVHVVPLAMERFVQNMPHVALNIVELDHMRLVNGVRSGDLDIAVANFPIWSGNPFVAAKDLVTLPTMFATRRGSRFESSTSLPEVEDATWLHGDGTEALSQYLAGLFEANGLAPPPPAKLIKCTSSMVAKRILENHDVIFLLPWSFLRMLPDHLFCQVRLPFTPPDYKLVLLTREGSYPSDPATCFLRCLQEVVGFDQDASRSSCSQGADSRER